MKNIPKEKQCSLHFVFIPFYMSDAHNIKIGHTHHSHRELSVNKNDLFLLYTIYKCTSNYLFIYTYKFNEEA